MVTKSSIAKSEPNTQFFFYLFRVGAGAEIFFLTPESGTDLNFRGYSTYYDPEPETVFPLWRSGAEEPDPWKIDRLHDTGQKVKEMYRFWVIRCNLCCVTLVFLKKKVYYTKIENKQAIIKNSKSSIVLQFVTYLIRCYKKIFISKLSRTTELCFWSRNEFTFTARK